MSINLNTRQNISYLFSGMNKSSAMGGLTSVFGDYASIKNGSYGKLMKAYYSQSANDSVKTVAKASGVKKSGYVSDENKKALTKVQSTTDALKESADALLVKGKKSLFEEKEITTKDDKGVETKTKGYDKDAIYKAVSKFVTDYNAVIGAGKDAADRTVAGRMSNLTNNTAVNAKALGNIGITVNDDKTLTVNKEKFMQADMNKVKTMFQGNGSYGYQTSAQASLINYAADSAVSRAGMYSASGNYSNYNAGNLFNGYF